MTLIEKTRTRLRRGLWGCLLAALLASSATGAAAQEWFSGPVPADPPAKTASAIAVGPVEFDVVISLHSNPQGDDDGNTQPGGGSADQDKIERILQHFANGVYESTDGAHRIRKIRIFRQGHRRKETNVLWEASGDIRATLNGLVNPGPGRHIFMKDRFIRDATNIDMLADEVSAGYGLAHEWGHFAYGLLDENPMEDGDLPVAPSIMSNPWRARNDQRWLNFSIAYQGEPPGDYENTRRTAQHRGYGKSGWETLATKPRWLEGRGPYLTGALPRAYYPELAAAAPVGDAEPTPQALSPGQPPGLDIIWMKDDLVYEIVIDKSGSMASDSKMENARTSAKLLVDLAVEGSSSIGILAFDSTVDTISEIRRIESDADRQALKTAIDGIDASGNTAIGRAAETALAKLQAPEVEGTKVVFLLSDGENTSGRDPLELIPAYQAAQIPIFAFAFGAGADVDVLGQMATGTRGKLYISPTTLAAVTQAFQDANAAAGGVAGIVAGKGSLAPGGSGQHNLPVDSTLASLVVTVAVDGPSGAAAFEMVSPSGSPVAPTRTEPSGGETLVLFSIDRPASGTWQLRARSAGPASQYAFQAGGRQEGASYSLGVQSLNGTELAYPQPLLLVASLARHRPIAGAEVEARLVAPDGSVSPLTFKDDGVAPDDHAGDGEYTAVTLPAMDGTYTVEVQAAGDPGRAVETSGGLALPLIDGTQGSLEPDSPVGEEFVRFERLQVRVRDVAADDHGDDPNRATDLPFDNDVQRNGNIEASGDRDVFAIEPAADGEMAIRVTDLALGMDPSLRILGPDGSTVLAAGSLPGDAARSGYLVLRLPAQAGQRYYAEVSHRGAATGLYAISAGPALEIDEPLNSGPCVPGAQTLCLQGGRFEVQLDWQDFQGQTGPGVAVSLTGDTGYFWFFEPTNAEIAVKILDGTAQNGHFWVFYGALSNVAYTLRVRDTASGNTATYVNPAGQFASRADLEALPAAVSLLASRRSKTFGESVDRPEVATRTGVQAACVDGAASLCLNGKYLVEVDFPGHGVGQASRLTADSGSFWIFQSSNVEMMVKVLDGRWLNNADWLFYGSLTDQAFELRVTDTASGRQRVYTNAQGMLASFGDIEAFPQP